MSWAAHQFEVYAVEAHLPKKMVGPDQLVRDLLRRLHPRLPREVLGVRHHDQRPPLRRDQAVPVAPRLAGHGHQPHAVLRRPRARLGIWAWKHNRAWTIGYLLGFAAHVLTDVNDSIGTMLLFPFSTLNWSLHTWAYAATVKGGKYLDAAAYYSSLGFAMDLFWLIVVLVSWRVLTREFWRTQVVPADPHVWSWLGQWFDDRGLLAIYRSVFFYGVCRMIAWIDVGARRRPADDQRRHAPRVPVRPLVDRAVVGHARHAAARHAVGRAARWRCCCSASSTGPRACSGTGWRRPVKNASASRNDRR